MLKTLAGRRNTVFVGIMLVGMLVMLRWISIMNYLLFHSLAELFSIIVAVGIFMLYWNARDFVENNYFVFISIAYLFISLIDLVHTLAYKGMGVFPAYDANLPTQLWIAARYLESLSLFAAIFFLRRKISNRLILYIFAVIFILFLSAIFGGIFPDCFVEGIGLTPFKKISEYLISMVLMVTIVWLSQKKTHFDTGVFRFLIASLVTTIFAELSFTFYNDVTGFSNFIGHIFKIISFYMIYRALLQIGLTKPYAILFHYQKTREAELKQSEEKYYNLFTYANDSIFIIHPKTLHILDVNENAAKRLGYLKDEILQLTIPDIAPLKEVSHYQEISQNVQDQERVSFESIHRCKDGSEMPVEITSRAIEYSGHRVIQSIVRDISERIRAEEAIRIRDEMWRLVGEMALIGGWEFDADTLEGVWTEEVARIHDLDPDQETSVEFGVAFYQGESRSKIENAIREAVEIGKPYDLELEITTARGNHKWVRTIGQPKQKDGKVVKVQGVFQDITSSKQIALEREALHLKLQNYNSDLKQQVAERTDELESRIIQIEELNLATLNLMADLQASHRILERSRHELAQAHQNLKAERIHEQVALLNISQAILGKNDSQIIMDLVLQETVQAFAVKYAAIQLVDADGQHYSDQARWGWADNSLEQAQRIPLDENSDCGVAILTQSPIIISSFINDAQIRPPDFVIEEQIQASLIMPMVVNEKSIGALVIDSLSKRQWTDDEVRLLTLIANSTAQALARANLFTQVADGRKRLKSLSNQLAQAQETERRNLARELHDQIGQALTAIKINLSALKFHTEKSDFNALIERNIDAADRAIEQVRNLSLNLRPSVLDDLGLVAALRWYAHSQAALTGMSINFNADEIEMRPSPDIETVFFRVAQEAFTNVLRHAQAQQIQIHLTQDDENLIMQISDDGVGFDVEAALRKAGAGASMGLLNIQERSELVGGILEIKSQPGEGSSIILRLPHEGQPNSQVRKP